MDEIAEYYCLPRTMMFSDASRRLTDWPIICSAERGVPSSVRTLSLILAFLVPEFHDRGKDRLCRHFHVDLLHLRRSRGFFGELGRSLLWCEKLPRYAKPHISKYETARSTRRPPSAGDHSGRFVLLTRDRQASGSYIGTCRVCNCS